MKKVNNHLIKKVKKDIKKVHNDLRKKFKKLLNN